MARISITTVPKGPFFENDPEKTFDENVQAMMAAIAREGEQDLVAQLRAGESSRAPLRGVGRVRAVGMRGRSIVYSASGDRVSAYIHGRVAGSVPWRRWAAISPFDRRNTERQAISVYAAAAQIQRTTRAFSRTASRLSRSSRAQAAELLKGIE